jgi:uncharacterized protein (TIGR02145 family)
MQLENRRICMSDSLDRDKIKCSQCGKGHLWLIGVFAVSICFAQTNTSRTTVTDADGNVYKTVKIGNQVWTVENLRTTKFNDGSAVPLVTHNSAWKNLTKPGYCWYDNQIKNRSRYGALYNWYAVDTKKLAPAGWHVPSVAEWDTLQHYLIAHGYNYDGQTVGNKIAQSMAAKEEWIASPQAKEAGTIGDDLSANNRSGFSALPGGCRGEDGSFSGAGKGGSWWSATQSDASAAYYCYLSHIINALCRLYSPKSCGFSVRLVKD